MEMIKLLIFVLFILIVTFVDTLDKIVKVRNFPNLGAPPIFGFKFQPKSEF